MAGWSAVIGSIIDVSIGAGADTWFIRFTGTCCSNCTPWAGSVLCTGCAERVAYSKSVGVDLVGSWGSGVASWCLVGLCYFHAVGEFGIRFIRVWWSPAWSVVSSSSSSSSYSSVASVVSPSSDKLLGFADEILALATDSESTPGESTDEEFEG